MLAKQYLVKKKLAHKANPISAHFLAIALPTEPISQLVCERSFEWSTTLHSARAAFLFRSFSLLEEARSVGEVRGTRCEPRRLSAGADGGK